MSKASTSTAGGGGGISQRYGILGGIVDIVVPSPLFHGGTILIENPPAGGAGTSIAGTSIAGTSIAGTGGGRGGGGDADSTACSAAPTVDTYSRTSRRILETAIDPKVINERFTPAATRTLHGPYLRQFETAFDLFLMQNPSLIPGNADTIDALRRRLLEVCEEKAMVEIELRGQLEAIEESKRAMERELTERLRVATREKAERRVELERAVERAERESRTRREMDTEAMSGMSRTRERAASNSDADASSSVALEVDRKAVGARQATLIEKSAASVNPAVAEMRGPPNNTTRHGHTKIRTTTRTNNNNHYHHRRPARRCPTTASSLSSYSSSRSPSHSTDPPIAAYPIAGHIGPHPGGYCTTSPSTLRSTIAAQMMKRSRRRRRTAVAPSFVISTSREVSLLVVAAVSRSGFTVTTPPPPHPQARPLV